MGADEVPGMPRRTLAVLCACAIGVMALAGCGEEDPQENVSETETLGPASAEGDIEVSSATLRSEEGFSTLVSTQITTRGDKDTLVASQIELLGSGEPSFRLKVDGETERDAKVEVTSEQGARTALLSCACEMATGEHVVLIEAAAKGSTAKVGPRSLVVFPEVQLDDVGSSPVSASVLETGGAAVESEGVTLAETPAGDGSGPLIVLASVATPRAGTGSENVRLEVLIGGDDADELAKTSIPSGKLVAYLDQNGAGKEVELRGYTTAGRTAVGISSIITCDCGLAR